MSFTVQQVVDKARFSLNDDDKVRVTDAQLLSHVNDFIMEMRKKRPDVFLGLWSSVPDALVLADDFPLADQHIPLAQNYVVARVEYRDDEFSENSRAQAFMAMFMQGAVQP